MVRSTEGEGDREAWCRQSEATRSPSPSTLRVSTSPAPAGEVFIAPVPLSA
jgi:hypothetical protein